MKNEEQTEEQNEDSLKKSSSECDVDVLLSATSSQEEFDEVVARLSLLHYDR